MNKKILTILFSLTLLSACTTDTSPVNARELEETEEEYYIRQEAKQGEVMYNPVPEEIALKEIKEIQAKKLKKWEEERRNEKPITPPKEDKPKKIKEKTETNKNTESKNKTEIKEDNKPRKEERTTLPRYTEATGKEYAIQNEGETVKREVIKTQAPTLKGITTKGNEQEEYTSETEYITEENTWDGEYKPYHIVYNNKEYITNIIDYNTKPEKQTITAIGTLDTQDNKSTYFVIDIFEYKDFKNLTEGDTITITDEYGDTKEYQLYERELQDLKNPDVNSIIKYYFYPNDKEELYIQTHFYQNYDYVNIYKAKEVNKE